MGLTTVLTAALIRANLIIASTVVIISFSLLVYLLSHNLRSTVARSFCALLGFVMIVYLVDVVLLQVNSLEGAVSWLQVQWVGITFAPATYLHFSDALLRTTNVSSRLRRMVILGSYGLSSVFLLLSFSTDLLVQDGVHSPIATQLQPGPFFWVFALYFFAALFIGVRNIQIARHRCLTSTSRRRMTYLAVAFIATALGVFPYLLIAGLPVLDYPPAQSVLPVSLFLSVVFLGNLGVALMMIVMAYSVAYFGILTPDRVVKHRLIHYLLRGPFVATCVVMLLQVVPQIAQLLHLPIELSLTFTIVGTIVLLQIIINRLNPVLDRIIYWRDLAEITWLQELDERLLTSTDLQQFLENLLTALCDLLRVQSAFVAVSVGTDSNGPRRLRLEAYSGRRWLVDAFLTQMDSDQGLNRNGDEAVDAVGDTQTLPAPHFRRQGDYWLLPLLANSHSIPLGVLGIEDRAPLGDLASDERAALALLVEQARAGLEDRHLQQGIFSALELIIPEIERIQQRRSQPRYADSPLLASVTSPPAADEYPDLVKDAFSHYWGGPKLTENPLQRLRIVQDILVEYGYNPAKALRAVLRRALEMLRPDGQRSMTTSEWLLYNIVDLKFVQGQRARDVAARLAMSESDLYRKQRVAMGVLAEIIARMEESQQDQVCQAQGAARPVAPRPERLRGI
jgi:hypothetical protein